MIVKEKKEYQSPTSKIVNLDVTEIICTSGSTETYDLGETDDWFN